MAVPAEIIAILREIPSSHFEKIPNLVKGYEKVIPKGKNAKDFFIEIIERGDKDAIQTLYNPLSLFLAAGGCCGGPVGVVFNSLDAAFCAILNNWFGFAVDILSIVLVFPGAKAGLTSIGKIVDKLPNLLGSCSKEFVNAAMMRDVVKRFKASGLFKEEMVKELYDICIKFIKDRTEVYTWLNSSHKATFEVIEARLKNLAGTGQKAGNYGTTAYGTASVGKEIVKTQKELKRGIDLSYRNMQPQGHIGGFLFIKPLGY